MWRDSINHPAAFFNSGIAKSFALVIEALAAGATHAVTAAELAYGRAVAGLIIGRRMKRHVFNGVDAVYFFSRVEPPLFVFGFLGEARATALTAVHVHVGRALVVPATDATALTPEAAEPCALVPRPDDNITGFEIIFLRPVVRVVDDVFGQSGRLAVTSYEIGKCHGYILMPG